MSVPWKTSQAESTCVRGKESTRKNYDVDTQTSDSEHVERERKAYPEESRRAHPAIGYDTCTEHRADVKCT
jgi:hypothetical protein